MKKLKTQRDKLVELMLTGMRVTRLYCVDNRIAWEVSARMNEIEKEYCIEIQRKRIKLGNLSMSEYWIAEEDMDKVKGMFRDKFVFGVN